MANRFLKGLAVAAGTGLAMGISSGRVRSRSVRRESLALPLTPEVTPMMQLPQDDEVLDIEPLLDRLERLEARIDLIERRPAPAPVQVRREPAFEYSELLADLDRRVEENTRELALLHESVAVAERRASESIAAVQRNVRDSRDEMPALVDRAVTVRFDVMQERFSAELEQAHQRTLSTFERAIDERIASRIGSIEKALAEQAGSIEALRVRATETDNNLQRLIAAIEKLCERAQLFEPALSEAASQRTPLQRLAPLGERHGFEAQFDDAMRREPITPVLRTEEPVGVEIAAPAFMAQEPKKSRFLFRNLVVAGLAFLASRLAR